MFWVQNRWDGDTSLAICITCLKISVLLHTYCYIDVNITCKVAYSLIEQKLGEIENLCCAKLG